MLTSRRPLRGDTPRTEINMGPLIDMVFLLLIFFVVTTSFVKEAGVEVQRSVAATAEVNERNTIFIAVTTDGEVYFEGRRIDVRSVRSLVERSLAEDPDAGIVVVADRRSETGDVVTVMDQCRLVRPA
jgi:biopolymer transport protein ExbD